MPLYEFKCKECQKAVELLMKFNDPAPVCANEECESHKKGVPMEKLISRGNFQLLGGGWYKDGY